MFSQNISSELRKLRQEHHVLKASLSYIVRSYVKQAAKYSLKNVSVMKLWHSYRKRKRLSGLLLVQPKNQFTLTTEWAVFI